MDNVKHRRIGQSRRASGVMTNLGSVAADGIYAAVAAAQRDSGDGPLAEALEKLAEGTGQNRFRHAAQIIRGKKLGRKGIDDEAVLRRIRAWPAASRSSAVGTMARAAAGPQRDGESDTEYKRRVQTIERRWRGKLSGK